MDELSLPTTPELEAAPEPPTVAPWRPQAEATPIGPIFGETLYTHVAEPGACACAGTQFLSGQGSGLLHCSLCDQRRDPRKVRPVGDGWVYACEARDSRDKLVLEYRYASDAQLEVTNPEPSEQALAIRQEVQETKARRRLQGGYLQIP